MSAARFEFMDFQLITIKLSDLHKTFGFNQICQVTICNELYDFKPNNFRASDHLPFFQ